MSSNPRTCSNIKRSARSVRSTSLSTTWRPANAIRYAAARSSCIPNIVMLETAIRELTAALEILRGTEES